MLLSQDLQTRTDAELAQMLATIPQPSAAFTYVWEEVQFRARHPEYRVA